MSHTKQDNGTVLHPSAQSSNDVFEFTNQTQKTSLETDHQESQIVDMNNTVQLAAQFFSQVIQGICMNA
jgi:hypothetical protein